jgi:hypothetical protein
MLHEAYREGAPRRTVGGLNAIALRFARDRVEAGLTDGVSLDEDAREVGVSRYTSAALSSMGLARHRYVTLRRVERV